MANLNGAAVTLATAFLDNGSVLITTSPQPKEGRYQLVLTNGEAEQLMYELMPKFGINRWGPV